LTASQATTTIRNGSQADQQNKTWGYFAKTFGHNEDHSETFCPETTERIGERS
jgi:hypothetical protein